MATSIIQGEYPIWKLLWSNPNTGLTSTMTANTTITLSNANYDMLMVLFRIDDNASNRYSGVLAPKGRSITLNAAVYGQTFMRTLDYNSDTQFTAQTGYIGTQNLQNHVCIPMFIYGLKYGYYDSNETITYNSNIEVLHLSLAQLGIGTKFTLSQPITNYRIIIIEAFATIYANSTLTRKFSTVTTLPYIDNDVGNANRYINLSVYYNSSYSACIGLKINSTTELLVAESITTGYSQIWGLNVYGIR